MGQRRSGLALASGALPLPEAGAVLGRVGPILVFLAAVTVLAELADAAGVFSAAAEGAARAARGSVPALFLLVAALATATTWCSAWTPQRCCSPRWC